MSDEFLKVDDVEVAAVWLAARGCAAAPVAVGEYRGVVYTDPADGQVRFAKVGGTLVYRGAAQVEP